MKTRETDTDDGGQTREAGKVVRIPRDWFGPPEELVPFGPRALRTEGVSDSRADAGESRAVLDPNAFWGEDSNSIHHVVEVAGEPAPAFVAAGSTTPDLLGSWSRRLGSRGSHGRPARAAVMVAVALCVFGGIAAWRLIGSHARALRAVQTASQGGVKTSSTNAAINLAELEHRQAPAAKTAVSRAAHRSVARRSRSVTEGTVERVSYRPASTSGSSVTSSDESVQYQTPAPTTSGPRTLSASSASTSRGSPSRAESQAAHPSPNGALTCLNCG